MRCCTSDLRPPFEKFQDPTAVAKALDYDPLKNLQVDSLNFMERHDLLVGEKHCLSVTPTNLRAALAIISMHSDSLRQRNQGLVAGRRIVHEAISVALSGEDLVHIPPMPGACLQVFKGMSGTSKTATVKRVLTRMLSPQKVCLGDVPTAHFRHATQLSYLFVGMSHDGTRGGLLSAILQSVDRVLGTNDAEAMPKKYKGLDRLANAVIALLHSYYLGLLVIDELQFLNIAGSQHAAETQLFLLALANSGLPLLLIGNPFAFDWLADYSQNLTRMYERPPIFFHPCGTVELADGDDWDASYVGISRYYVLNRPPSDSAACSIRLKQRSGGIQRNALTLWSLTQKNALIAGRESISSSDIEATYHSDDFEGLRNMCDGFAERNPLKLLRWRYTDIPVEYYADKWKKPLLSEERPRDLETSRASVVTSGDSLATSPKSRPRRVQTSEQKFRASQTREKKKQAERERVASSLVVGDARFDVRQHAMASLDALMREANGSDGKS